MKSFDTLDNWHDEFLRQVDQFSFLSFVAFWMCSLLRLSLLITNSVTRKFHAGVDCWGKTIWSFCTINVLYICHSSSADDQILLQPVQSCLIVIFMSRMFYACYRIRLTVSVCVIIREVVLQSWFQRKGRGFSVIRKDCLNKNNWFN